MQTLNIGNIGNQKRIQHTYNATHYLDIQKDHKHPNSTQWNLNKTPYPFATNQFQHTFCSHTLEHLTNPQKALQEIIRISQTATIYVPHRYSKLAKTDKQPNGHKSTFTTTWFCKILEQIPNIQYSINLTWNFLRPLDLKVEITKI